MWNFPRLPPYGTALVTEKLLPASSLAMSLAVIMPYGWVLSLHEKLSHPQPSSENHKPWNKINQHTVIATVAFAIVKGVFKICFQVHFPTSHLQSFVSQASATSHSPHPGMLMVWAFITECLRVSVTHTVPAMLYVVREAWAALLCDFALTKITILCLNHPADILHVEEINIRSGWWAFSVVSFFFLTNRGD